MKREHLFIVFLIVLVGSVIYSNTLDAAFLFDDIPAIVENHLLQTSDIKNLFLYDPSRFISHWSFALNIQAHGFKVQGFHIINIILHCVNAILVYYLLLLTFGLSERREVSVLPSHYMAFLGALIFLVHPIQTQAVTYIVQRSVLLASLFYFLTLIVYIKLRFQFNSLLYAISWVIVMAGCMTKPIYVTVPLSIVLYEFFFLRPKCGPIKNVWISIFPYCLPLIIIPILLILFMLNFFSQTFDLSKLVYATSATSKISRGEYLLTQFQVIVTYLRLLVWPWGQNVDYDYPLAGSLFNLRTLFSFLLLLSLIGYAVYLKRKGRVLTAFSIVWFFIFMIPESSIFPLPDVIFEHRVYPAVVSFAILLLLAFEFLLEDKRRYVLSLSFVIIVFSILTFKRNLIWSHPAVLLEDIISKSPLKSRPRVQMGFFYQDQRLFFQAEKEYKKAIELDDKNEIAYNKLGILYGEMGRNGEALEQFQNILRVNPHDFNGHLNLGIVYYKTGQFEKANAQFQKAMNLNPKNYRPYYLLGKLFNAMKQHDKASHFYTKAIAVNPYAVDAYYELGNLYLAQAEYRKAIEIYQKVLRIDPQHFDAHNTLGIAYLNAGEQDKAGQHFLKALSLNPRDRKINLNLSQYYKNLGDKEKSQYYLNKAHRLP